MKRALVVMGTRPEIIKLGPVYRQLRSMKNVDVDVFFSGQHVELASGLLELFDIQVTYDGNNLMGRHGLPQKLSHMLSELSTITEETHYDWIIVQGDTTTATAGSMIGFLNRIPVAHVEAGLRTWNLESPWPEEFNRRVITLCSTLHFCPTDASRDNLLAEGVPNGGVKVTGNTVIDALEHVRNRVRFNYTPHSERLLDIPSDKKLILVTGHRRENFGLPLQNIVSAIRALAKDGDKAIVFPVHLNPDVKRTVYTQLSGVENVYLVEPLTYPDFVYLMERAWTILTDSGGIQEEAPSFHRPIAVTRTSTERPEAVEAGFARLVGSDVELILETVREFTAGATPISIPGPNPFGNGDAAARIASVLFSREREDYSSIEVAPRGLQMPM